MAHQHERQPETEFDERPVPDVYLPAMPSLSTARGRVERFLVNLFRRRGGLRKVVRNR